MRASENNASGLSGKGSCLQPDLEDFIRFVRSLGLAVKLDTNGYQPNVLINLCKKGLLDYVAMDIKAGKSHYAHVSGRTGLNLERIDQSIRFLLNGSVPFEFRTTLCRNRQAPWNRLIHAWPVSPYFPY